MRVILAAVAGLAAVALAMPVLGEDAAGKEPAKAGAAAVKAQTTCPVMGGAVNKSVYADVNGYRVYACCQDCVAKIKAEPDTYLAKIKANGETPEKTPAACQPGAAKGGDACCGGGAPKADAK